MSGQFDGLKIKSIHLFPQRGKMFRRCTATPAGNSHPSLKKWNKPFCKFFRGKQQSQGDPLLEGMEAAGFAIKGTLANLGQVPQKSAPFVLEKGNS